MNFLFDTCAVSESASTEPNRYVLEQLDALRIPDSFLSCVTIGEIRRGIALLDAGRKKQHLENWLQTKILPQYAGRIIEIDMTIMLRWGTMIAGLEQRGLKMLLVDSLIAATALVHDLTVVTRNVKDFTYASVRIFNPWK